MELDDTVDLSTVREDGVTAQADARPAPVLPVDARFSAEQRLGAGGMGEVFVAHDEIIGRRVAVKHSPPGVDIVAEARAMAKLSHPAVVPIYDVEATKDGGKLVMKLVEGQDLRTLIAKLQDGDVDTHAKFPHARRLDIVADVFGALSAAHAVEIVHRDVKPENIMVGVRGEVYLVDWGIACPAGPQESVAGTPAYMAPEQRFGAEVDARTDLYATFSVLYELLTLQSYGDRKDPPGIFDPSFSSTAVPVPAELRHFLIRGLQFDPDRRFQSVEEALATLDQLRSGDFPVNCTVTALKRCSTRFLRFAERYPRLLIALSAMVALALVLVGLSFVIS